MPLTRHPLHQGLWTVITAACVGAMLAVSPALAEPPEHLRQDQAPDNAVWLDELDLSRMLQGWGDPGAGESVGGHPIRLNKQIYQHGVGSYPPSGLRINLKQQASRFEAMVGVDDEVRKHGSVRFEVLVDGQRRARTELLKGGDASRHLEVDLTGAQTLDLVITDGGDGDDYDHADWAGALIHLKADADDRPGTVNTQPAPPVGSPAPQEPRIHHPLVVGTTPGRPFRFRIPITGEPPMRVTARNLPAGLELDEKTGILTGSAEEPGLHRVTIEATNDVGEAQSPLLIVADDHKLALTPPMGWNSWNIWGATVTQQKVEAAATAMHETGLADHGWRFVNIDDAWMVHPDEDEPPLAGKPRTDDGRIRANGKFPDMPGLTDHIHQLGLKAGIYTSPGPRTCQGFTASHMHEFRDARRFAQWGFDYLKYDLCGYRKLTDARDRQAMMRPYRLMRHALDQLDRDIVYSLCQYGITEPWKWAGDRSIRGNSWRTTYDIEDTWASLEEVGFQHADLADHAGPGRWNDADMLVVGKLGWGHQVRPTRLSKQAQRTQLTLWSLIASPLLLGNDLTQMDRFTRRLLTNPAVLAVSQDPRGEPARRISRHGPTETWARPLWDGTWAVGLFNRGPVPRRVEVSWDELTPAPERTSLSVRDLWSGEKLGPVSDGYAAEVAPRGCLLLKVGQKATRSEAMDALREQYRNKLAP